MLGKLIKHEWRSVCKVGYIILLTIFVVTLIGGIFLNSSIVVNVFAGEMSGESGVQSFGAIMLIMVCFVMYTFLLSGAVYGIMIYMGVHFYKTMYTNQGYLIHTLPVTPHQILISKTVVSGIWTLLVNATLILSMVILIISCFLSVSRGAQPELTIGEAWASLGKVFEYGFASDPEFKTFAIVYVVVLVVSLLMSPFFSTLMVFGGLTIGQLAKKHKMLMSILSLIGVVILYSIISTVVAIIAAMSSALQDIEGTAMPTDAMSLTYGMSLGSMVLMGVLLYFISHYIISKKLNMD